MESTWPLPAPHCTHDRSSDVRILLGNEIPGVGPPPGAATTSGGALIHQLQDGSHFVRWPDLFEFLISPEGRLILGRPLVGVAYEAFSTYLLGQVMSFALLKQGLEPLHATVVVRDGRGTALLGDSGYGKSSLAAASLAVGYRILTDDLLVVREHAGRMLGYPGPPRLKLFPEMARRFLPGPPATPMNPSTRKLVVPLRKEQYWNRPASLERIYAIASPRARARSIRVRRLSRRQAFLTLTRNTFNAAVSAPQRLERQFRMAARLAAIVPVSVVRYPRSLDALRKVRDVVLADSRVASVAPRA